MSELENLFTSTLPVPKAPAPRAVPAREEDLYDYKRFPLVQEKNNKEKLYRAAYGRKFPAAANDAQIEMWCSGRKLSVEDGGLGEKAHFKEVLMLLYPYLRTEWNYWLDRQLEVFLSHGTHSLFGAGSIGKSWCLGTFARIWQACAPYDRGIMVVNTTQASQTDRAWKYVIDCCNAFPWMPGKLHGVKDLPILRIMKEAPNARGDATVMQDVPGVGILSKTVKKGTSAQATADLKGLHPRELMVIVEESNHLKRHHIERARANWITNPSYIIILTGNPEISDSEDMTIAGDDSLFYFSEPVHGWKTIKWGEKFIWDNKWGGKSVHFDAYDSPRIKEPEKFKVSTWLPTLEYIAEKARELGGENTPLFKQQIRGIYDFEALPMNLITPAMCDRFGVRRSAKFTGYGRQRWAAFDPAFSGNDEAFLKIAETGLTEEGRIEIDFLGEKTNFSFKINTKNPKEPSFQMLEWVREILDKWGVPPENFTMDATAIGFSLGDIFTAYLSKKINKVAIMGKPSERWMDLGQTHTARDKCYNRASEMWLALSQLIVTEQVKGLDDSIINQLCDMPGEISEGGKVKTLEKVLFRRRFGYSPDRAEACLYIVDLLRDRGFKQNFMSTIEGNAPSQELGFNDSSSPFGTSRGIEDIFINKSGLIPITADRSSVRLQNIFKEMRGEPVAETREQQLEAVKGAYGEYLKAYPH